MKIPAHMWRTADGRLVPTGHLDAEILAYPAGTELTEDEIEKDPVLAKMLKAYRSKAKSSDTTK